ncbi:MAG: trypsin-like peptidase domain-containing protein [Anaerolineae bacterium]|nr:trypsin-like peptidase domain-containing protein [Anaerolineae bacterium]
MDRKPVVGKIAIAALCLLLLVAAGCGLPDLVAPDTETPEEWQGSETLPTTAPSPTPPEQWPNTAPPTAVPLGQKEGSTPFDERAAANDLEARVIAVYDAASPSVVNITNRSTVYDRFFGASPQEGTGSGFVYDVQGHIVTNYHVIEGADEILVTLADGQVYEAEVVGSDPTNDLAVLRIDPSVELPPPLILGDSSQLRVGQFVVAIGNPYGLQRTLTTGVVSALGRVIESPEDNEFIGEAIQTDAAINPGNSGGPMLDLSGRVIGISSQIISPSGASAGIGFAVSANTVQRVAPKLITDGYYPHPWLGIEPLDLSSSTVATLRQYGVEVGSDSGVLVLETAAGGPADQAGVRGGNRYLRMGRYRLPVGGDVIVAVNGKGIEGLQDLTVYLENNTAIGDMVQLSILRDGKELTVQVTLDEQPQ